MQENIGRTIIIYITKKEDKTMPLSSNIRARREELLISPNQLAQKVDLVVTQIYDFERGITVPKLRPLVAIADALDVSVDWLLDRKDFIKEHFSPAEKIGYDLVRDELPPLSANIRSGREKLNFSIEDLAICINVHTSEMYDIERGIVIPSLCTLVAIANVLNISVDRLLNREKKEKIVKRIAEKIREKANDENCKFKEIYSYLLSSYNL
ncbi:MAG: transcriptional regulator [Ruminiclostridium sp.]|nr:transcriptional regulator [Ruminiclostridium sp.]